MSTAHVARLRIYPFKSLDGVDVDTATLTQRGGLRLDRAFAFVDANGDYINGKAEPRIHRLHVRFDVALERATFFNRISGASYAFTLDGDLDGLAAWIGNALERRVQVRRDDRGGFPDDREAPGPTIVSTATLETIASWFEGLDADSVRRRLRTNIEVAGVPAFWEDSLYGVAGELLPFRIGDVVLQGTNPCQRCVVPSRDPESGAPLALFAKTVAARRAATLPPWAERTRFNHFYRLAVNTSVPASQMKRTLRLGQRISGPLVPMNR